MLPGGKPQSSDDAPQDRAAEIHGPIRKAESVATRVSISIKTCKYAEEVRLISAMSSLELLIAFEKATNYVTLDTLLIMSRRHARASRRARGSSYPALSILVKLGPEEVDRFRRYLKPHCID